MLTDMVKNIPLDYMHLVCLGVQKKSMSEWVRGKYDRVRLSPELLKKVSQYLVAVKGNIPSEFPRKTRTLDDRPCDIHGNPPSPSLQTFSLIARSNQAFSTPS